MEISRTLLAKAVEAKIITEQQVKDLVDFIEKQTEQSPNFTMTNVLYYLGGLIAIGAMTLFMNLGWEAFGGWGIFSSPCFTQSLVYISLPCLRKKSRYPSRNMRNLCRCFNPFSNLRLATRHGLVAG